MSRKFLEVFVVGDLNYRCLVRYPNPDKSCCITSNHAKSGVGKRTNCTRVLVDEAVGD